MSFVKGLIAASALIGSTMAQEVELGAICERETAYVNPIVIEVTVPSNTVIDVYGEVMLTVTDAPTSISTLTYGTRTETETYIYTYTTTFGSVTGTATGAATALPTVGSFDTPFALAFVGGTTAKGKRDGMSKRDTLPGVDLVAGGGFSDNCADASSFYLQNGTLYRNGYVLSTSGDSSYQELAPVFPALEIIEYFSILDAVLSWTNGNFADVEAFFCEIDELMYAVFDEADTPAGCSTGTLYGIPGANCPGFTPVYPVSTASSTASGASSTATNSMNSTSTASSASGSATNSMNSTMTASSASGSATSSANVTSAASSSASSTASSNSTTAASSSASSSESASSSTDTSASSSATSTDTSSASSSSATSTDTSSASSTESSSTSASATATAAAALIKEREADEEDRVLRRRRSKFNTRGKLVHGGFAEVRDAEAELAADEDQ